MLSVRYLLFTEASPRFLHWREEGPGFCLVLNELSDSLNSNRSAKRERRERMKNTRSAFKHLKEKGLSFRPK